MKFPDHSLLLSRSKSPLHQIEVLHLSKCSLDSIENLEECTKLKNLYITKNKLKSLDGLEKLRNLWRVDASDNLISNLGGLLSFEALGFVSLQNNQLSFEDIFILQRMNIVELELKGNRNMEVEDYRFKVICLLPCLWILDGEYITSREREESCKRYPNISFDIENLSQKKYCTLLSSWRNHLKNGDDAISLIAHISHEPRKNNVSDMCRLRYLLQVYQVDQNLHNHFCQYSLDKLGTSSIVKSKLHLKLILSLPMKMRLQMSIILLAFLEFILPKNIVEEALVTNLVSKLTPQICKDIVYLPSYVIQGILCMLKQEAISEIHAEKSNTEYDTQTIDMWSSLPDIGLTPSNKKWDDCVQDNQRRHYHAVILLSRSPSFPTMLSMSSDANLKKAYKEVYSLLNEAKMTENDLYSQDPSNNNNNVWFGGLQISNSNVKAKPKDLPWNSGPLDRSYRRPWQEYSTNGLETSSIEKVEDPEKKSKYHEYSLSDFENQSPQYIVDNSPNNMKPVHSVCPAVVGEWIEVRRKQYVPIIHVDQTGTKVVVENLHGAEYAPFTGSLIISSNDIFRVSSQVWRHKNWAMKCSNKSDEVVKHSSSSGLLQQYSDSFRKNGTSCSQGVLNYKMSPSKAKEGMKPLKLQSRNGPTAIDIYSIDSALDSHYVLAPPSGIEIQNNYSLKHDGDDIKSHELWKLLDKQSIHGNIIPKRVNIQLAERPRKSSNNIQTILLQNNRSISEDIAGSFDKNVIQRELRKAIQHVENFSQDEDFIDIRRNMAKILNRTEPTQMDPQNIIFSSSVASLVSSENENGDKNSLENHDGKICLSESDHHESISLDEPAEEKIDAEELVRRSPSSSLPKICFSPLLAVAGKSTFQISQEVPFMSILQERGQKQLAAGTIKPYYLRNRKPQRLPVATSTKTILTSKTTLSKNKPKGSKS